MPHSAGSLTGHHMLARPGGTGLQPQLLWRLMQDVDLFRSSSKHESVASAQFRRNHEAEPNLQKHTASSQNTARSSSELFYEVTSEDQQRPAKPGKVNQCKSIICCLLGSSYTLSKHHTCENMSAPAKHPLLRQLPEKHHTTQLSL